MRTRLAGVVAAALLALGGAACSSEPADGWVSVGTGDTYGEWELFAEAVDGKWTGCLRLDHFGGKERCGDAGEELVSFESGEGARYGAVADGVELEFDHGGEVQLLEPDGFDRRFFVVADDADIEVSG
jgi:hypothetical protein